ncbi:MAG: HupE/UreJ family protein [Verrucomicrobium sp.]
METFFECLKSGFSHIIPDGPDHVLFVLGLFLMCREVGSLLWQITLFTLAHSLTLALALCGIVSLPDKPVEILIALSIAFIALENVLVRDLSRWRPWVIVGFGLMHGFGFAGAFVESGIPLGEPVIAIVGLNLGVELGQLAVVLLAAAVFGRFWTRSWYRRAVTVPGSLAIGGLGLSWALMRLAS